jgi:hypothetical protein
MVKRLLIFFSVVLLACSDDNEVADSAGILANIKSTNLDSNKSPWIAKSAAHGMLKRWDIENNGVIAVKLNGAAHASTALDKIEEILGFQVFDRTSIANTPDDQITRGLIVSQGTAINPSGGVDENTCGMVSAGIGTTSRPQNFYSETGEINTVLYVHLSSSRCTADLPVTIHEFGHALGLGQHFNGFGDGDPINENFWNVLYNLYHNPIGSTESALTITKIM